MSPHARHVAPRLVFASEPSFTSPEERRGSELEFAGHLISPHVERRRSAPIETEQANGTPPSSSTHLPSHSTPPISSTRPLVAHSLASTLVSCSHVASRPERANGPSNSPSIPLPSCSTAHNSSSLSSPPCKKRSRRCFVCGQTGKHRLNPRFCPRTFELISKHLATFDANFRLVSFDGSPLPMTRNRGGVAAHLLSPRRHPPRTPRVSPRRVSESSHGLQLDPPHVALPASVRPHAVEPSVDSNPPHVSHPIPHTDHSVAPSILHFPPVERLPSPPIYIPVRIPLPDSKPPADSSSEDSTPHISLSIFELLFVSPPIRDEFRKLIDMLDRGNIGHKIPSSPHIRKVFYRIFDRIVESLSSPH